MSKTFKLQVVAPFHSSLTEEVTTVILPGEMGEFGVLAQHMSLLAALKPGPMRVVKGGQVRDLYYLAGGFAEIHDNSVIVLAEGYTKAEEIDVQEAQKDQREAEELILSKKTVSELETAKLTLARAKARLKVVEEAKALKK